jgi:hypothetical protein
MNVYAFETYTYKWGHKWELGGSIYFQFSGFSLYASGGYFHK